MGETGKHAEIESTDAQSQLWNQLFCFINSMSLSCAVELGIAEIITSHGSAPVTLPQLVASIPVPPNKTGHLRRIMRLLVHSGVFASHKLENGDEGFLLTPMSRLLVNSEDGNNLSPFIRLILDSIIVSPWHSLGQWLKGDDGPATPFGVCHGAEFWDLANRSSYFNSLFNQGMACDSKYVMSAVVDKCAASFNGLSSLVDVAGGTGSTAQCIAEAFPHMNVSVLDLLHVVAGLQDSNVKFIGGDMFHSIPLADAVFLKWVLHGWNDEDCVKILKKCKEAIPNDGGGKVMILDIVVNFNKDNQIITKNQYSFDLLMMVVRTGMERDEEEWKHLFDAAGYTSYKITPLLGGRSFIELYP